ncbi:hypothetical protein [Flaviaesturariibacter aridisoli]|uniref:Uncharacterized protein n=1 Tax=Flaviaesturariibacter aridisoli TaxID=2545761 RepID=A0A4R4E1Y7_9BACT|nr:hypothetical protein [Flaviaesturariibacter aridisoli]TCZ73456.1 hypothetical protein E0486_05715 [Flaviaesturariibacter aridisoli]
MKAKLTTPLYYVFAEDDDNKRHYSRKFSFGKYAPFEKDVDLKTLTQITFTAALAVNSTTITMHTAWPTWYGLCHLAKNMDAGVALITPNLGIIEILIFPEKNSYSAYLLEMVQTGAFDSKLRNLRKSASTTFPFINQLILQ